MLTPIDSCQAVCRAWASQQAWRIDDAGQHGGILTTLESSVAANGKRRIQRQIDHPNPSWALLQAAWNLRRELLIRRSCRPMALWTKRPAIRGPIRRAFERRGGTTGRCVGSETYHGGNFFGPGEGIL